MQFILIGDGGVLTVMDGGTLKDLAIKVSQYFLDFLESDFKRQQAPRRRVVLQNESGFKSGMRVSPYPDLQKDLWTLLGKDASSDTSLALQPRSYRRPISPTMQAIIKEQVQALAEDSLTAIRHEVVDQAQLTRGRAVENPEKWVNSICTTLAAEIGTQVVGPLLALLDGPLSQQAYSVHDSIFATESELIELLAAKSHRIMPEVLSRYLATGEKGPLEDALEQTLSIDEVRTALTEYFEKYMAADAFLEFRDLETYAATGDNLQLYLYIGTLKFGNLTFPLFYVPIDVQRSSDSGGYTFNLVRHLYANKRAIDFVLQELGQRAQREWLSPIKERISYLDPRQSLADVATPLFRDVLNALDLGGQLELKGGAVDQASNTNLAVTTALHLSVFDRADEALLNDYEEMIAQARKNEPGVVELFQGIVRGVILENPKSITEAVEADWDSTPVVDRVVIDSPVPLNEEQIKILKAIRQKDAKIIVVEGPPGTGKSHTITAIAADSALRGRSCLILSDKAEALNVVQSKLTDAMNTVRHDKNFPNPILRLGQEQANFKKLTSNQSLTSVSAYVKAAKAKQPQLLQEQKGHRDQLQGNINKIIDVYGSLPISDISTCFSTEATLEHSAPELPAKLRALEGVNLASRVRDANANIDGIRGYLSTLFEGKADWRSGELIEAIKLDAAAVGIVTEIETEELSLFPAMSLESAYSLATDVHAFERLRMPLFGYLFRGSAVLALENKINSEHKPTRPISLKADHALLKRILGLIQEIRRLLPFQKYTDGHLPHVYPKLIGSSKPHPGAAPSHIITVILANAFSPLPMPPELLTNTSGEKLTEIWVQSIQFLHAFSEVAAAFASVPEIDYAGTMSRLEKLNITSMNAEVDNRLVSFMNNHKADAKTLAAVISNRQKFPEDKFSNVKESFPVIISSIRQFGEYMPLVPNLFDVVVIDEASQVSVAQAFPALLRAKTVVVLGDTKQFSNTKSANASNELNDKYRSELEAFFRQKVSQQAHMLERLAKFDVKCSILDFCGLCANYSTMLRKHFRSYQELISYSSQTFYAGQLQAIKIRDVPLDDVIRFDIIDATSGKVTRGTNEAEANFILERLLELLEEEDPPTVGVITPFREQQVLVSKLLFGHAKGADFQDKLRLKIMTFDSCQGEEREIIFYSMVATKESDLLNYVFPVEIGDAQEVVEDKLKHQRLNVGFSRAEEMIWFVLSKPITEFKGSIAKVFNHYSNILEKRDVEASRTDQASPMEARVLDWLQKTAFYQKHRDAVEIMPQFPIGDYLRQLDPTYQHPAWKVDFLITFTTSKASTRIVLEYDGFEFHFQKGKNVNIGNHERYMLEADVERQLTLESYGYRFIRINRFNLGKDPVQTLSDRLERLVEAMHDENEVVSVRGVQEEAEGLANKKLKTCSRCGSNQPVEDFFDPALKGGAGGFGRVCKPCKDSAENAVKSRQAARTGRKSYRRRWRR